MNDMNLIVTDNPAVMTVRCRSVYFKPENLETILLDYCRAQMGMEILNDCKLSVIINTPERGGDTIALNIYGR